MLKAICHQEADYVPCSFMIFSALRAQCRDDYNFVERQLEMGLDATVALPMSSSFSNAEHSDLLGLPVRFDPQAEVSESRERRSGPHYVLVKEYHAPKGTLSTVVNQTDD